jgi:sugar (pentulose or hexulose) kinase
VVLGLKTRTIRGELLKSFMESVPFDLAEGIQALRDLGIDSSEVVAKGGGPKSDRWLQSKANIIGIPFLRPYLTERRILGAAILAATATTGVLSSPAECVARFVERDKVFEPTPYRRRLYQKKREEYPELFHSSENSLPSMKRMNCAGSCIGTARSVRDVLPAGSCRVWSGSIFGRRNLRGLGIEGNQAPSFR